MSQRKIKRTFGRRIRLNRETRSALQAQFDAFRQKFGRDPGPDDPVFFDATADTPKELTADAFTADMMRVMADAGIPPELIYAFRKTGRIVTTENMKYLTAADLAEWDAAIQEYFQRVEGKPQ